MSCSKLRCAAAHSLTRPPQSGLTLSFLPCSAAVNNQTSEGVAIKKVTNVFSKKILAKRALREIKLLQHFRGHRNVCRLAPCRLKAWDESQERRRRLTAMRTDHLLV